MAHITLPEGLPGIRGPMAFRPETAKPLNEMVDVLLRGPHPLTPGERELIATYVSSENDCYYCQTIHGAIAAASLNDDESLVKKVKHDFEKADITPKLKALLVIAGQVQKGGKYVTGEAVAKARAPCSLLPHSACTTATWMAWGQASHGMKQCIVSAASELLAKGTSALAKNTYP
jgi:AhpD family alkylhydroperoxidase